MYKKKRSQKRMMGVTQCTSLVIGSMIGTGIFSLPAALAPYGSISLVGWIISAFGAMCLALVHARLSNLYPETGGPYVYAKITFGRFAGFQASWNYWLSNGVLGNVALAITASANLAFIVPAWNNTLGQMCVAIGILWCLTFVNALGVVIGGRLQVVLTFIKIIPLILISCVGVFYINWSLIFPLTTGEFSITHSLFGAVSATLYAFIGLEASTIPASNIENPKITIPLSTILGTGIVAVLYILTTLVLMGLLQGKILISSLSPFSQAVNILFGSQVEPWLGNQMGCLVSLIVAVSAIGTLNSMVLLQGQMPYAAAKDGLFPKIFTFLSPQGVPSVGLYLSTVLVTLFLLATT